jgi:predicted O-methyltransferase YrrM
MPNTPDSQPLMNAWTGGALRMARRVGRRLFPRRPTVIHGGAAGGNPFDQETIERWFSSTTRMDSQLEDISAKLQGHRIPRPTFEQISLQLFGVPNIYANYQPASTQPEAPYATHIQPATLEKMMALLGRPPRLGLEVGSYVGHGACVLGSLLQQHHGVLLCVDTWCGDVNMWLGSAFAPTMGKEDGNPDLYHHFIRRIKAANLDDTVIPVRVSSVVAARMLKVLGYEIDFVYLDSAHEAGETFLEMNLYYDLLRPGGVLLGDDYSWFPAVQYDVRKFLEFKKLKALLMDDRQTWILHKPLTSATSSSATC